MQVSRSIVSFSKFGACCCRGSAASPCARIKPHELAVTARRPPGPVGVVAGLLGVSNYGTRPFVAQERGKNHQLQHWLSSAPNISFQATLRKKPRKAPELHRSALHHRSLSTCARKLRCAGLLPQAPTRLGTGQHPPSATKQASSPFCQHVQPSPAAWHARYRFRVG